MAMKIMLVLRRRGLPNDLNELLLRMLAPKAISPNKYAYLHKKPLPSPYFWPAIYTRMWDVPWQSRLIIQQLEEGRPIHKILQGFLHTLIHFHGRPWVLEMLYVLWNIHATYNDQIAQNMTFIIDNI